MTRSPILPALLLPVLLLPVLLLPVLLLAAVPAMAQQSSSSSGTQLERQSWRAQQTVLSPAERREGERRLDAIDHRARSDPRAARDMQRIWEADRALGTLNRPGAGPSLVGPGDKN